MSTKVSDVPSKQLKNISLDCRQKIIDETVLQGIYQGRVQSRILQLSVVGRKFPNIDNYSQENKIKTNENPQKICLINRTH